MHALDRRQPCSPLRRTALPALALALACTPACVRVEVDASPADASTTTTTTESPDMTATAADFYSLETRNLAGDAADLSDYKGQVSLVINVASECGLTPQYTGLQALHTELADQGFTVLAFPSNDFGGQEPGSPEQIQEFCTTNYAVTFPLFEKVQTKAGKGQSPVYAQLESMTGELPSWNFAKYVVSKDGTRVTFFGPKTPPDDPGLRAAIEAELAR